MQDILILSDYSLQISQVKISDIIRLTACTSLKALFENIFKILVKINPVWEFCHSVMLEILVTNLFLCNHWSLSVLVL